MAILVTRPEPDNEKTAAALRARGYDALLAPMMRYEAIPFHGEDDAAYDGVVITSANAIRAIESHPSRRRLFGLRAFAVGDHTAEAARNAGFGDVVSAAAGARELSDLIVKAVTAGELKRGATLCYLAGADLAHDLAADLGVRGFTVVTHTTYRMVPVAGFPAGISDAFRAGGVEAVLHYSRRSARAFLEAARAEGVEISALALPQCCISDAVAGILREAGAMQVAAARAPDEQGVFDALDRTLKPASK
ncbi:uroporphyrinogen-III synthase [soil metagenome]